MKLSLKLVEAGLVPDPIIRRGIHKIDSDHLKKYRSKSPEELGAELNALIRDMKNSPMALYTDEANRQHYELPAEFFVKVLGKHLKYSCCLYEGENDSLDGAEEKMLELTCKRAGVTDGMKILDLGCGWGSLSLYIAENYKDCEILSVSNSRIQGEFIRKRLKEKEIDSVTVKTADINDFRTGDRFDRIISIEMFEHLRNYCLLFNRIRSWLTDEGRLFFHIFVHREYASIFEQEDEDDWIAQYFFTGGLMPSVALPLYFQEDMVLEKSWLVGGMHYHYTAEHWLRNMDSQKEEIIPIMKSVYGEKDAMLWFRRWRIFFIACSELWGYDKGREWMVCHYLMKRGR